MSTSKMDSFLSPDIIRKHGINAEEYQRILAIMGREPNILELGIFSVMWSEHCSYKSTRLHLKTLPTKAPWVICGPGENAGVIDIGDGQAAIFKMESHNHPSFIEPYQGAATGVGGILRDVFTMGARPVALMNALRFGDINHKKTPHLLSGVVAGIGGYGNCIGVPTIGGECNFHHAYNGNILVNAMCIGLAYHDKIFYSAASDVGSPVVYFGSKTGRDGIHGATMASSEFDDNSAEKRPTVQVGDPFTEKLVLEACLELMGTDAILAIQDMGAAGLTCSSLEMAGKGGTGIELELDKVPMREEGMTPYELMLSESQERMLMVIKPGKEELVRKVFEKWDIPWAVIGKITDTKNMVLKFHGKVVAQLPVEPLSEQAPVYDRPHAPTPQRPVVDMKTLQHSGGIIDVLIKLIASPNLTSKRWIWEQYDSQVMNDTIEKSGGDAAIIRVHGTKKALAISTDCTPRYCYADPIEGGKQAVAENWRNITATGAKPLAITNCLNFGNPERPEIMGQLIGCLDGMKQACTILDYPVISGNVSLYNETNGQGILPTPAIGGVGLLLDLERRAHLAFCRDDDAIILIGSTQGHLGASLYLDVIENKEEGNPPPVDLSQEKLTGDFIRRCIEQGEVTCCHDIADGGLVVAVAEMALAGNRGATLDISISSTVPLSAYLFGEDQGRYIIAVPQECCEAILHRAEQGAVRATVIGSTGGSALTINQESVDLATLRRAHESTLPALLG